jgi:hypothetical protein
MSLWLRFLTIVADIWQPLQKSDRAELWGFWSRQQQEISVSTAPAPNPGHTGHPSQQTPGPYVYV